MPRVRPFNDPAARLSSNTPDPRRLAPAADVRPDATGSNSGLDICGVVALVEAKVLRTPWTAGGAHDNCIECTSHEPLVVDVRSGDLGRERHAPTIRQNVPLHPSFCAVRRIRPGQVPPLGALTIALSSDAHFHWMPRCRS